MQRGHNRQPTFLDREDHLDFLARLKEAVVARGLELHAYVLMPDHFHLLATPATDAALSAAIQDVGRAYVRRFNRRHQRTGTLWDGRFRCAALDAERDLLVAMRYIETNPVRAALVGEPSAYPWSSHGHHVGLRLDPLITDAAAYWNLGNTPFERQDAYRRLCDEAIDPRELEALRRAQRTGTPLPGPQTLAAFEARGQAMPRARPRGRPRKVAAPHE